MVQGDGPQVMGLAQEVRVSNSPSLEEAAWRIWAAQIEWTLTPGEGEKTVYLEFRDREGRVATGQARITLSEGVASLSPPATSTPPGTPPPLKVPSASPVRPEEGETMEGVTSTRPYSVGTEFSAGQPPSVSSRRPVPFYHWLAIRPEDALPWVCGLQTVAALLGFIIAARRQRPSPDHREGKGGQGKWR